MTQAYNLSQLANNLNTLGQLDATDGLIGATPIVNGGTGAATAAGARANLDVPQAAFAIPSGGIIMWSGSIASIPTGWLLCNGASGTPDLRNRFVIGASVDNAGIANTSITGANTQTGGSKDAILVSHTHTATVTDPGHFHAIGAQFDGTGSNLGTYSTSTTTSNTSTKTTGITVANSTVGSSATNANLNPYYALAFIMKS